MSIDKNEQPNALTRRGFVVAGAIGTLGVIAKPHAVHARTDTRDVGQSADIDATTIMHAEKLASVEFTADERAMMTRGLSRSAAGYKERQKESLPNGLAPATVFDSGPIPATSSDAVSSTRRVDRKLPTRDAEIAFAPVTHLAHWMASGQLTSVRLTQIYLKRLKRFGPKLECVVTLTETLALEQARRADKERASGNVRSPLHGIPYGAKDLFDTAGIATTFGAEPYKDRVPESDAAVVRMLRDAGAVLIAKTTLGALAMGDVWFGGKTRNPFDLEQGSSGSSAGSAAGTSAGLFGFSLGTETLGSIVSPSMRCGATGLRPTFGRVPRTGAMALCWSLDKVGPICRTVEDTGVVLEAISGRDAGDPSSVDAPFSFDAAKRVLGLRVGIDRRWFEGRRASEFDRKIPAVLEKLGVELVDVEVPRINTGALRTILNVEAAAAFEELTLSNRDDLLTGQTPFAWPNSFRTARFVPAIELVQADRLRRRACTAMSELMSTVDCLAGPSFAGGLLTITNFTGHPSLTLRSGMRENGRPTGMTVWGQRFDEATVLHLGMELEREFGVWNQQPKLEG